MIQVCNLTKAYDDHEVFSKLNLVFPVDACSVLMGESGCGKTTLLRILMGLETADSGEIIGLEGLRIRVVFQEDRLCEDFSALSNARLACSEHKRSGDVRIRRETDQVVLQHLEEVGLQDSVRRSVRELSGGMKRRVAIVRAILAGGDLLLLDEPFKGLDEQNRVEVAKYIQRHTKGVTTIMVTHDTAEVSLMGAELVRFPG